jgi:hypothetical protein
MIVSCLGGLGGARMTRPELTITKHSTPMARIEFGFRTDIETVGGQIRDIVLARSEPRFSRR